MRAGATVRVAVTVGLGDTPEALKVMTQEWVPMVVLAALTEAVMVTGVAPDAGATVSQAQSEPSEDVYARPAAGLVLLSETVFAAGTVPPIT